MKSISRVRGGLVVGLVVALAMTACGSDGESATGEGPKDLSAALQTVYDQARKEGSVNFYSSHSQDQIKDLIDAFEEKYPGVEVHYTSKKNNDVLTQLKVEQAGKRVSVDVTFTASSTMLSSTEVLQPVDWKELGVPDEQIFEDEMVFVWASPPVWVYNTDRVKKEDAPKTWDELADPKWKGKDKIALDTRASFLNVYLFDPSLGGEDAGVRMAEKLIQQNPTFSPNTTQNTTLVTSGQVALTTLTMNLVIAQLDKGAPIAIAPIGPVHMAENYAYVPKAAPHPSAAKLLTTFLASTDGQKYLAEGNNTIIPPSSDGCKGDALNVKVVKALCDSGVTWHSVESLEPYKEIPAFSDRIQKVLGVSAGG